MTDKELAEIVIRALFMIVRALEKRYGLGKHAPAHIAEPCTTSTQTENI